MQVQIVGKIVKVLALTKGVSKAGKEYATQDYVIEMEDGKILAFNVFGNDRINQFGLKEGMKASVRVEIESREWNGRYYTSARCFECFSQQTQQTQAAPAPQPNPAPSNNNSSSDVDMLPF